MAQVNLNEMVFFRSLCKCQKFLNQANKAMQPERRAISLTMKSARV